MTSDTRPLRILFVTPECAPWAKTGGLGDVSAALPKALRGAGHDVRVLMPAYRPLRPLLASATATYRWSADGPWPEAQLFEVEADGLSLLLLDCPGLFDRPGTPYGNPGGADFEDSLRRFAFLSHVAARLASDAPHADRWSWPVDVLHANDWPTALSMAYLGQQGAGRAIGVFTVHNLAFQGLFPKASAAWVDLPPAWLQVDALLHWDELCLMKAGLVFADVLTTVSPTYATEIQTEAYGCGLEGLLQARRAALHGILNGIEPGWNPATDALIVRRYDRESLDGKAENKRHLQARFGLPVSADAMLFGAVSRITAQKGVDLMLDSIDWMVGQGHQLVVLGKGDADLEAGLREAAARHPAHVAVVIGFDEGLAHQVEAGVDAFVMPSRFEPCGLNQMYSLAYGTPPIVRSTGGLADSVVDVDAAPGQGTGFRFDEPSGHALRGAIHRAAQCWRDRDRWRELQRRGMAARFGWADSAARYVALYRAAIAAQVG